jgi:hypothetical protein
MKHINRGLIEFFERTKPPKKKPSAGVMSNTSAVETNIHAVSA